MKQGFELNGSWEACRERDFDRAKELGRRELDDGTLEMLFAGRLGLAFAHSQDLEFEQAITHFNDALSIADQVSPAARQRLWLVHGLLQRELGEHNIAIHQFERYLGQIAPSDDPKEMAFIYELLGMACLRMGRYAEAHELWGESDAYERRSDGGSRISRLHAWRGLAYVQMGRWFEAAESYKRCLETATGPNLDMKVVCAEAGIAAAKAKFEDPAQHLPALRRAVRLAEAKLQSRHECYYLLHLAETLMSAGEKEEAIETYLRTSEVSLRSLLFMRTRQSYRAVLTHFDEIGDEKRSLQHYRGYVTLEKRIQEVQFANREISLQLLETVREFIRHSSTESLEFWLK